MNNELIKKAYEHFNGVWPEGWESVIVSTEKNSTWCEGQYQNYPDKEDIFNVHLEYLGDSWQWVGTKSDFDIYRESLKTPEGATHFIEFSGSQPAIYYKYDKSLKAWDGDSGKWVDILSSCLDRIEEKLTLINLQEEWLPDPDSMCEIKHDNEILSWKKAKYIGVNTVGSKKYAVVFFPYISEYKNYKLDDSLKFRPIKTEAVKDATDVYHACELLVKEGFKQCAG